MPSRTWMVRASNAMEEPGGGTRARRDRPPLPETPRERKSRPAGASWDIAARRQGVRVGGPHPEHRSQKGQEPGEEVSRDPPETPTRADSAAPERRTMLLRLAQGNGEETRRESGALDEKKQHPRSRGGLSPHQPARDGPERDACGPAEEIEE